MNLIESIILGILQGITEFLPISSSGHLAFFKQAMKVEIENPLFYDVSLHIGTTLSVLFVLRKDILDYIRKREMLLGIIVSFLFTVPVALVFENFAEKVEENLILLSFSFFVGALILFSSKFLRLNFKNQLLKYALIGIMQGVSATPGISRSGTTISTAFVVGFTPQEAFSFSFILSVPTILSAISYKLMKVLLGKEIVSSVEFSHLFFGILTSFVFGVISLYILRKIVINYKLWVFGIYMLFMSVISIVWKFIL
jgi:undecaprenyl-diphosphatase